MKTTGGWSLRRRLLIWLLVPVLLVSVALLLDAYRGARRAADHAYDGLIAASALAIADRVVAAGDRLNVDIPYVALAMLRTPSQDRVFYGVRGPGGVFVTGYSDLPLPPRRNNAELFDPVFYDAHYRGELVRVGLLERPVTSRELSGRFTVQVAQTRGERDRLARDLALGTAWRLLSLIALVLLVAWLGVRFALVPLERLGAAIRGRSAQDLSPLQVPVPREVSDLVWAIDSLMARLERSRKAMERFISDAAHQLRTPLAALHTQVELALQQHDEAELRQSVGRLQAATWRTSRLARQLLNQARASSDAAALRRESLDLARMAMEVTRGHVPAALVKNIDLGFEGIDSAPLMGDPVMLRELLTNLIDNALRYCPEGTSVTVRVRREGNLGPIALEVEDDGPGIPEAERERAFERFHRGRGSSVEGSGLGLSIVRDVAQRLGGEVSLSNSAGGGLLVRVVLPAAGDS